MIPIGFYSTEQLKYLETKGITPPKNACFEPGKHCPGEKPFEKSDLCYKICFGTHGIQSVGGIPAPCKVSAKNHGSLGSCLVLNMSKGIAGI